MDEAWEVVSAVSEFSLVGDSLMEEVEDIETMSVSTATGFPALSRVDFDLLEDDDGSTQVVPRPSFKEALMLGAGGPTSSKAIALQAAPSRLPRVARKPRQRKVREASAAREIDFDYEYFSRKARGQRLYRLRAPRAKERCAAILEDDDEPSDFDSTSDFED
eukprot:CAMPEP_0197396428 /NCGR_PEP_ID=MMETSP1165-20131217/9535_1 /TAXON_ID=284809 /ORGANISM="Chrysocystis fragilis, Strain CCMP3189" /LENGTH=161 /DNA_ID=CAMNT_0042922253 /DNA_START=130 /DNA_END=615 /DNA_ORIENTATION=+